MCHTSILEERVMGSKKTSKKKVSKKKVLTRDQERAAARKARN